MPRARAEVIHWRADARCCRPAASSTWPPRSTGDPLRGGIVDQDPRGTTRPLAQGAPHARSRARRSPAAALQAPAPVTQNRGHERPARACWTRQLPARSCASGARAARQVTSAHAEVVAGAAAYSRCVQHESRDDVCSAVACLVVVIFRPCGGHFSWLMARETLPHPRVETPPLSHPPRPPRDVLHL